MNRTLEIKIEGEEIEVFANMLNTLKNSYKQTGYKRTFKSAQEQDMLEDMHYNLIGQHEENND